MRGIGARALQSCTPLQAGENGHVPGDSESSDQGAWGGGGAARARGPSGRGAGQARVGAFSLYTRV